MVSQSVSLGIEPHLGPMTRYLFLSDSYVLVSMGRPLWREEGSVFCMSFSGPSPLGLAIVFYCLTFETSLFVASYDSHGHGGGIRPRLHLLYNHLERTTQKTQPLYCWEGVFRASLPSNGSYSIVACVFVAAGICLSSRYLVIDVYSEFAIPPFERHVAILFLNL
jgi:hypothetical protein